MTGDPSLNFGLFLYCGLLPFLAFSEAMNKGMNTVRSSAGLVQKVIFPMEILPFTNTIASMIDKFFGVGALLGSSCSSGGTCTGRSWCCRS